MKKIVTGLNNLLSNKIGFLKGKTLGLVVNHTSLAEDGRHSIAHFQEDPQFSVNKLFSPEHGLYGIDQDMIGVEDSTDPVSGLPVVSLYGHDEKTLAPDPALFADIDTLVFDIQDVGSRYYTYIYTLANCMEVCGGAGIPIVVCDRPNPINGIQVEGNLVRKGWESFVGQYPIPNRHGMTVGELANLFRDHFGIQCDLTVVPMKGWQRSMWYDQTGLTWVAPSPNMAALSTATVYPGMCLVEGTNLSEGRGTTLPFELCGAPYINPRQLVEELEKVNLTGLFARHCFFKPSFQKWAGKTCGGIQLHVTDRDRFKPFLTGLAVIRAIARLYPDSFVWRTEPYEFVSDRLAIDLLYGHPDWREKHMTGQSSLQAIEETWQEELQTFKNIRREYLLY